MKIFLIIIYALISLPGRTEYLHSSRNIYCNDTTKPFIKEISDDYFYSYMRQFQKQLNLESLANGYHGFQVRIWEGWGGSQFLTIITEQNSEWKASYYELQIGELTPDSTYRIVKQRMKPVVPTSGWPEFSQRLLKSKIMTFPDASKLPSIGAVSDGTVYLIEIATKDQYRFYISIAPYAHIKIAEEVKYLIEILYYIRSELSAYFRD